LNLPNKLTISRLVLTVIFICLVLNDGFFLKILAVLAFAVASLTDYLDGYFAKKHHLVTDFGKIMDPIADKFLILSAFVIFTKMYIIPFWMTLTIVIRETLVTALRLYAVQRGKILAAESLGKFKTVLQIVTIFFILFFILFIKENEPVVSDGSFQSENWELAINVLMHSTVVITVLSGILYLIRNNYLNDAQGTA